MNKIVRNMREIPRSGPISKAKFLRDFGISGVPVVFEGLTDHWKAHLHWSKDHFSSKYGKLKVTVARSKNGADRRAFTIRQYMNYIYRTKDRDPYYLRNWTFHLDDKALLADYQVPEYFKSWVRELPKKQQAIFAPWSWFYIGPRGSGSPLHVDTDYSSAWNVVISGKKLWVFYSPDQGKNLYKGLVDAFHPDLKKYPYFSKAKPFGFCLQRPGEIVFTPSGWWHQVINLEPGISLTENFINESNYKFMLESLQVNGNQALAFRALAKVFAP